MLHALIAKELRENRLLIAGFLIITPLLSLGLKLGIRSWEVTGAEDSMSLFVPGMLLLFVLGLAADLVASDSSSGRFAFLAALPVRPSAVWAAKAVILATASILFLCYVLGVEAAILSIGGKDPAYLVSDDSLRWSWLSVCVAVAGTATFACSSLIDRGLAVVIAAAVMLAVVAGVGAVMLFLGLDLRPGRPGFLPGAGFVAAAFLTASFATSSFGRIHLGARVRRFGFAALGFLAIAMPATVLAGAQIHHYRNIEPHQDDYQVGSSWADQRCEWAVVSVGRPRHRLPNWSLSGPSALWAIRIEDGKFMDLSGIATRVDRFIESDPGSCLVSLRRRTARGEPSVKVVIDLETGRTVPITPVPDQPQGFRTIHGQADFLAKRQIEDGQRSWQVVHPDGRIFELPPGWNYGTAHTAWGMCVSAPDGSRGLGWLPRWLDFDTGKIVELEQYPTLLSSRKSDWTYSVEPSRKGRGHRYRLDRLSLTDGTVTNLMPGPFSKMRWYRRNRAVLFNDDGLVWLNPEQPEPIRIAEATFTSGDPVSVWPSQGTQDMTVYASDGRNAYVIEFESGTPVVRNAPVAIVPRHSGWFDGRQWFLRNSGENKLVLKGIDGSSKILLPTWE